MGRYPVELQPADKALLEMLCQGKTTLTFPYHEEGSVGRNDP